MLPGAVHKMVPVEPGDVFRAEFAHLGAVTVRFSKGASCMSHRRAQEIADVLIDAERERKGIAQFSDTHPDIPTATAYEAQQAFVPVQAGRRGDLRRLEARPDQPQQAAGDGPGRAALRPGDQRHARPRTATRCGWTGSSTRGSSREIAFLLARDIDGAGHDRLGAGRDRRGVRRGGRARLPLRELPVHAVRRGRRQRQRRRLLPRPDRASDPTSWWTCALLGCVVRVDGEVAMTAAGAAVMGHPAASVAWLANQLAAAGGRRLQRGAARLLRRGHRAGAGGRRAAASPSSSTGSAPSRSTAPDGGLDAHAAVARSSPPTRRPATPSSCSPTSAARTPSSRWTARPDGGRLRVRLRHRHAAPGGRAGCCWTPRRADAEGLAHVEDVLERHLERFGARARAGRRLGTGTEP